MKLTYKIIRFFLFNVFLFIKRIGSGLPCAAACAFSTCTMRFQFLLESTIRFSGTYKGAVITYKFRIFLVRILQNQKMRFYYK